MRAGAYDGSLTVEVYGHREDLPGEYDLETAIIGPPPTVEVYRVLYQGDKVVEREYLYTDVYDVPPEEDEKKPEPSQTTSEPEPEPEPRPEPKPEAPVPAPKPEAKTEPEPTPPAKPESKPTEKPTAKPSAEKTDKR